VTDQLEHFRIERQGDVTVVTPTVFDFLDQVTNFEAKRELTRFAQNEKPEKVVVDFCNVQRFSTEFIGTLLSFKRQMGTGGRIALCSLQPVHRDIFRVLNLDGTVFQIFGDVPQAVASLN
jgi:anti-anti-sigma factor